MAPSSEEGLDMATGASPVPGTGDKVCPSCGEMIKAAARVCRYCHTRFDLRWVGYCTGCHGVVDADENGICGTCAAQVADLRVRTTVAGAAGPAPAAAARAAAEAPALGRVVAGASAASTTRARRKRIIGFILALAGGLLLAVTPFMDWLTTPGGTTVTGWDLYTLRSQAGENVWVIPNMFSDSSLPFFTGLTILVAGVVLVALGVTAAAIPRSGGSSRFTVAPTAAVTLLVGWVVVVGLVFYNLFAGAVGVGEEGDVGLAGLLWLPCFAVLLAGIGGEAMVRRRFSRDLLRKWLEE